MHVNCFSFLGRLPNLGHRHFVALMGFFGAFNIYTMRVNLSVAIVAMVATHAGRNSTFSTIDTSSKNADVCPLIEDPILADDTPINASISHKVQFDGEIRPFICY